MTKIRINDLARELEVKSKAILDVLLEVGVTEKKTHSSSIEEHEAEKVRAHFRTGAEAQTSSSKPSRTARADADEIKTKIDLSHISKPGDVLKAITQQHAAVTAPPTRPPVPHLPTETKPVVPSVNAPAAKAAPIAPPKAAVVTPPPPAITSPAAKAPASTVPEAPSIPIKRATPPPVAVPTVARSAAQFPAAPPATALATSPTPSSPIAPPPPVPPQPAPPI